MPTPFSRTMRSLEQDSSRSAIIAWIIGGVVLAGWLFWFVFAKITVYEVSTKARLEVDHSAHPVSAASAGKIIAVSVALSQQVKRDDVLVTLDASSEKLRLQEEESKLKGLPPQISALEKEVSALEKAKTESLQASSAEIQSAKSRDKEAGSAVAFARENDRRLASLRGSGKIPVIESLRAHAEVEKLSAGKEAIVSDIHRLEREQLTESHQKQAQIEDLKGEVAKLSGELVTTQITIARLKEDIEKHVIRAPADGQIGELAALQIGAYVAVGDKMGTVVPRSKLRIVAEFPPASVLGRIHPGQASRMRLDGFPWTQFGTVSATVSRVGAEIRDNIVRVEFTPHETLLKQIMLQHGLPGAIEVAIEEVSPAVMVLRVTGQWLAGRQPASG